MDDANTREVKGAIISAANRSGEDGRGTRGLEGYMFKLSYRRAEDVWHAHSRVMPTVVSVEHKDISFKSVKDVRRSRSCWTVARRLGGRSNSIRQSKCWS